ASFCQIRNYNLYYLIFAITLYISCVGALHRRLEWQTCAAIALAVHSDPSPVIVWPLVRELLRTCAALAACSENPASFPPGSPARSTAGAGCFWRPPNSYRSGDRPMRRTAIYGGHIARGADRSAHRRLGGRSRGFPRWRRARQSHALACPPHLIMLDWNKRE